MRQTQFDRLASTAGTAGEEADEIDDAVTRAQRVRAVEVAAGAMLGGLLELFPFSAYLSPQCLENCAQGRERILWGGPEGDSRRLCKVASLPLVTQRPCIRVLVLDRPQLPLGSFTHHAD